MRGIFIFVEGNNDELFFKNIIKPKLEGKYDYVKIIKHANEKKEKIKGYIKSINSMGAEYIFVVDINNSPCITARKQEVKNKLKSIDEERIIVVIKEIESWYLAGLEDAEAEKLGIPIFSNTDNITKEQFDNLIPKKFSRIDFMLEVLRNFSIKTAKQKNGSFRYFIEKYDCKS